MTYQYWNCPAPYWKCAVAGDNYLGGEDFTAVIVCNSAWHQCRRNNPSGGIDGFTRYVLSLFLYSHAIKADLSVLDNDKPGEDLYKSYNGTFVIEQRSIWGDK